MPGHVHIDDRLPILREHVVEHLVAQNAGSIEHDMQAAERVARLLDHGEAIVELGDRPVIGDSFAAGRLDLVDQLLRRRLVKPLAAAAGARVVDDNLGAVRRHQFCDLAADPAAGAGADRDASIEHAHRCVSPPEYRSETQLLGARWICQFARRFARQTK